VRHARRSARGRSGRTARAAAIERFLQLAAERDYVQMGWIFGNPQGAILRQHPVREVEQRMYALAHVLQHDGYVLGNASPVPGLTLGSAVRYNVALTRGCAASVVVTRTFLQVPITVARGPILFQTAAGTWS
jgi:hypothetical protein